MVIRIFGGVVSFCVVVCLFQPALLSAAEPLRVITLGDSITKGVRPGVTDDQTFAAELQRQLRAQGHADAEVLNVGIGGEIAGSGLKRLDNDVVAKQPAIVTIMYGHNDSFVDSSKTESRVSIPRFRADLSQLVQRLRECRITPILMTPPAYAEKSAPNGIGEHCNLRLSQYAQVARDVAETLQVPLIDHFAAWSEFSKSGTDLNDWTTDGYHPNPQGHVDLATRSRRFVDAATHPAVWVELSIPNAQASRVAGAVIFSSIQPETRAIQLPRLNNVVYRAFWVSSDSPVTSYPLAIPKERILEFSQTPAEWRIALPDGLPADATVRLELEGMPRLCTTPAVSRPGADGVITFSAHDAVVHGMKLQFEPLTHKNTVGYWVNPSEYAEWSYALDTPGEFHVEILQGCGGHAGSDVELGFQDCTVPFVVDETGHFQNFIWRRIGRVKLQELGVQTMSLKCKKLAKGAVMDMRQVRLIPAGIEPLAVRDMRDVAPDLVPPTVTSDVPAAGRRSSIRLDGYVSPIHHTLYLPTDWNPNRKWPILVEWTDNNPDCNEKHGEVGRKTGDEVGNPSTLHAIDGQLAYGISGGSGAICLRLPFLNHSGTRMVTRWWGDDPQNDPASTVRYLQSAIADTCAKHGGDPDRVVLVGFAQGSIAVNAVGLSCDEAARLWKAAVCFSHYDGVGKWPFAGSETASARERLKRLGQRPQYIINESLPAGGSRSDQIQAFIQESAIEGEFTFASTGFLNQDDDWVLRPSAARTHLREWLATQILPK